MARWVERRATEEGWKVRLRQRGRTEEGRNGMSGRRERMEMGRHMSYACKAGRGGEGRGREAEQEGALEIQLGDGFNPCEAERVGRQGIDQRGLMFTEITLVAGLWRKWPKTMVVAYGREAYQIQVEATRTPMMSKMSWAELVRGHQTRGSRSSDEAMSRGREAKRRKRQSSHLSRAARREPRRSGARVGVDDEARDGSRTREGKSNTQGLATILDHSLYSVMSKENRRRTVNPDKGVVGELERAPGVGNTEAAPDTGRKSPGLSSGSEGEKDKEGDGILSGPDCGPVERSNKGMGGSYLVGPTQQWRWIHRDQSGMESSKPIYFGSFDPHARNISGEHLVAKCAPRDEAVVEEGRREPAEEVETHPANPSRRHTVGGPQGPGGDLMARDRAHLLGFKVQEQRQISGFVNSIRGEFGPCGPFVQEDFEGEHDVSGQDDREDRRENGEVENRASTEDRRESPTHSLSDALVA
ncbi:hypothetical protein QJS10_CPA02g00794 [Acorus calamus]|uniref:Uncharacterized protein n=1 Tax=Acorus calamus TaxID=4465 RepID=A0AAV9FEU9_ACOCL|nr:hypothetical protein QJS10_CPA02g00794 [Acorus calamus]